MYAVISRNNIQLPPGTVVRMPGTWQDYCVLRDSRGDGSIPRMKFRDGEISLMSPVLSHSREAHILASIVEVLLDSKNRNYEAFTPITMDISESSGIEPDYCFYIDNWQSAVGKDRIDWQTELPPDLVIEIDVTTYTAAEDYLPYRVPEVWLFKRNRFSIYQNDRYILSETSQFFPGIDVKAITFQCLQDAAERGTGAAIRAVRSRF